MLNIDMCLADSVNSNRRKFVGLPLGFRVNLKIGSYLLNLFFFFFSDCDRLNNKATRLRINRTEVEITEGEITRVITENIEND